MPLLASTESIGNGRLVVVGIGIQLAGHVTAAAQGWIRAADKVFYIAADPATVAWICRENPSATTLRLEPPQDTSRADVYDEMVDPVLDALSQSQLVCLISYGHPGVLVGPVQRAVERAGEAGYPARLLPGISAEDCLFADLGQDPGETGWQSYDATDFLIHNRRVDPSSALILYQVAMVGSPYHQDYTAKALPVLVEQLASIYGMSHQVMVYEAAVLPIHAPEMTWYSLSEIQPEHIAAESLLYVPPSEAPKLDPLMLARLAYATRAGA
jgi:hypothetical protein